MMSLDGVATAWSPLLVAAALVVLVAGVAKIRTPSATAGLLRPLLGDAARPAAVALGVVEVGVGAAAISIGSAPVAAALAGAYGVFLGISLWARGSGASCGCFGETSTRPDIVHIALVAAGLVAATGAALTGSGGAVSLISDGAVGAASVGSGLLAGALAIVLLTVVPTVRSAGQRSAVPLFHSAAEISS
ncbi:MAG: MauE/DoxX family redox-associated membrane protein [Acidimicrobiales bacterium]